MPKLIDSCQDAHTDISRASVVRDVLFGRKQSRHSCHIRFHAVIQRHSRTHPGITHVDNNSCRRACGSCPLIQYSGRRGSTTRVSDRFPSEERHRVQGGIRLRNFESAGGPCSTPRQALLDQNSGRSCIIGDGKRFSGGHNANADAISAQKYQSHDTERLFLLRNGEGRQRQVCITSGSCRGDASNSWSRQIRRSTSLVTQTPCIQSATFEDNILFGRELVTLRLESVTQACALQSGLDTMANGLKTEIGGECD